MRQPSVREVALGMALLVPLGFSLACGVGGGEDEDELDLRNPPMPNVELVTPQFVRVRPGQPATFEYALTWPDGEMPSAAHIDVWVSTLTGADVTQLWIDEPHRYQVTLPNAARGGETITPTFAVWLESERGNQGLIETVDGTPGRVQILGGDADVVVPPVASMRLAVDEVRPVTAFPATVWGPYSANPNDHFGERFWSDEPLTFAVDDASVATVSADGVLVGVAPGATTLRIGAGSAEGTVELTVEDVPLGPPPLGATLVHEHQSTLYEPTWAKGAGPLENKVALDHRGWPMIAVPVQPGRASDLMPRWHVQQPPLLLARWTGTGFGYEWLDPGSDRKTHPVLEVDEAGHVYAIVRDGLFNRLELWDRPGDVTLGGWQIRELPRGVPAVYGDGDLTSFDDGVYTRNHEGGVSAPVTLPREGGGIWAAWASVQDTSNPWQPVLQCPRMLRVAALHPEGEQIELVELTWLLALESQRGCDDVLGRYGQEYARLALMPPTFGSPWPGMMGLVFNGEHNLRAWRWDPAGWIGSVVDLLGPVTSATVADLAPVRPVAHPGAWIATDDPAADALWAWYDPFSDRVAIGGAIGAVPWDEDPVTGEALAMEYYAGHAVSAEHVFVFGEYFPAAHQRSLWLTTARVPERVDPIHPRLWEPVDALYVTEAGARLILAGARLLNPDGDAHPGPTVGHVARWMADDRLHLVQIESLTPTDVIWEWDGAEWSEVASLDIQPRLVDADGTALGTWLLTEGNSATLWHVPPTGEPTSTTFSGLRAFVQLAGVVAHPDGSVTVVAQDGDLDTRVMTVTPDGMATVDGGAPAALHGPGVFRTSTGRLLVPPKSWGWGSPSDIGYWASDDDGATWDWLPLDGERWQPGARLLNADGGLVLVGTRSNGWHGPQAAALVSTDDGATWSGPYWIRPEGRSGQVVAGAALDVDGTLLVVLAEEDQVATPAADVLLEVDLP